MPSPLPRRQFLAGLGTGAAGLALTPALRADALRQLRPVLDARAGVAAEALADDEAFWAEVRRAFDLPADVINLDNGNINPAPRAVTEAVTRNAAYIYPLPPPRQDELYQSTTLGKVRPGVARLLGVPPEEVALVRNATEALDTVLLGFPLERGDEVVCSTHDYYAMLDALEQRRDRDGIVLRKVAPPIPLGSPDDLAALYEQAIGPRTRLVLITHPSNLTGQLAPVRRIVEAAHRVGAPVVVDGAQSMALVPYTMAELGCDFYGASLHKWLMGPVGSGVLWMKPEFVERVWPLVPSPAEIQGMDRYMWSGTYPEPVSSGVLPALELHERLGSARKLARMRFLADHWRSRVERLRGARCYVRAGPEHSCGIVTLELDGVNPEALKDQLWARHRIVVQDMSIPRNPEIRGIRITPNVYTSVAELDRFVTAVQEVRAAY